MYLIIGTLGLCLLLIVSGQCLISGFSLGRRIRRQRANRRSLISIAKNQAEIARLHSELHCATHVGTGNSGWRVMEVVETVDESADCRSFYLVDPYGQPLADFRPGQYLMVRPALTGDYQPTRCYSLSSAPDSRYWRITVKRQEPVGPQIAVEKSRMSSVGGRRTASPTSRGGLSAWLHDHIATGDCLLIGGPHGNFCVSSEHAGPLVLLAAGVGVTPMASMLRWSLETNPERPVLLLYQAKDPDHWPLGRTLHTWQTDFPNCHVASYFSRSTESQIRGDCGTLPGRLVSGKFDAAQVARSVKSSSSHFFLCGPDTWMRDLREGLLAHGVAESRIHWESFGGSQSLKEPQPDAIAPGADADSNASDQDSHSESRRPAELVVDFDYSEVRTKWSDPEQSLWELARESGVDLPSGCLSGVCGCCRVRLLAGNVTYKRQPAVELGDDQCLACIAQPASDLHVDA